MKCRPLSTAVRAMMLAFTLPVLMFLGAEMLPEHAASLCTTAVAPKEDESRFDQVTVRISESVPINISPVRSSQPSSLRVNDPRPTHADPAASPRRGIARQAPPSATVLATYSTDAKAPQSQPHVAAASSTAVSSTAAAHEIPPRELTVDVARPLVPPVIFRPLVTPAPEAKAEDRHMQLRLAGMERKLERMADLQLAQQSLDLDRAMQLLDRYQQESQMRSIQDQYRTLKESQLVPRNSPPQGSPSPLGPAAELPPEEGAAMPAKPEPVLEIEPVHGSAGDHYSLHVRDADIRQVLDMLGQLSGMNILASPEVTGMVTVSLNDVSVHAALNAILRSFGYVHEQDGDFIFVMTTIQADASKQKKKQIVTKIYQPLYISSKELLALITPLLTPEIGRVSVTSPAEVGIASDPENAGGDTISQHDAVVIIDYADVIDEVDAIIRAVDVPPLQVVIEAMILNVRLDDDMAFGVNFALLNDTSQSLTTVGSGASISGGSGFPGTGSDNIVDPVGALFGAASAGLKYGLIRGDIGLFVKALEEIADTSVVAAPQLRVLNKQKAELIIGRRVSYATTTFNQQNIIENVNFLDTGTKLILRPYATPDGMVRMEVHPERSNAVPGNPLSPAPDVDTTELTTNVMVRDGATVVLGGLIEETVRENIQRVPLLGSLPVVGAAFRNKTEKTVRTELIVLITPRIVNDDIEAFAGEQIRQEHEQRADHFRDNLTVVNRRNLARVHYERAVEKFEKGELRDARHEVERSLQLNKNDLQALQLRNDLDAAILERRNRLLPWPGR